MASPSPSTSDVPSEVEKSAVRKAMTRLLPLVFGLYLIGFLDRSNISYAQLGMSKDLGIGAELFGFAASVLFLTYFLFEVPSNYIMERVGARKWLARIGLTWGIITILNGFVTDTTQLIVLRALVGAAEAGLGPGVVLYLTYWFPNRYRGRATGLWLIALPFSSIVAAPLCGAILRYVGWFGLSPWRWIFIVTGVLALICGVLIFLFLKDHPKDASWLTAEEKAALEVRLAAEEAGRRTIEQTRSPWRAILDRRVLILGLAYALIVMSFYGITFWLPQIVKGLSTSYSDSTVAFLSMIPFVAAGVGLVLNSYHSDRTNERRWHIFVPCVVGVLGFVGLTFGAGGPGWSLFWLTIATIGSYGFFGAFWGLGQSFLAGTYAAIGIAAINAASNLGGFVGVYLFGFFKATTGSENTGMLFLAACLLVGGALCVVIGTRLRREENAEKGAPRTPSAPVSSDTDLGVTD